MSKFIIYNETDICDGQALRLVARVIEERNTSHESKQYPHLTRFSKDDREISVISDINQNSDKFTITG